MNSQINDNLLMRRGSKIYCIYICKNCDSDNLYTGYENKDNGLLICSCYDCGFIKKAKTWKGVLNFINVIRID